MDDGQSLPLYGVLPDRRKHPGCCRTRVMLDEPEYRVEGPLKVTGRARYAADVRRPDGLLHMVYVRRPYAHALIRSIDTSRGLALPGVHAILAGADLPSHARFGRRLHDWLVVTAGRRRF